MSAFGPCSGTISSTSCTCERLPRAAYRAVLRSNRLLRGLLFPQAAGAGSTQRHQVSGARPDISGAPMRPQRALRVLHRHVRVQVEVEELDHTQTPFGTVNCVFATLRHHRLCSKVGSSHLCLYFRSTLQLSEPSCNISIQVLERPCTRAKNLSVFFSSLTLLCCVPGRMDIDVSLVEDCRRLAKQCKMADLIDELENKCKHVYEFGKTAPAPSVCDRIKR